MIPPAPADQVVAANAGVAISIAKNIPVKQGVEEALELVHSGAGIDVLNKLIK